MNAIPAAYDDLIREAAGRYVSSWDFRWLKSQYYQESLLDPNAKSDAGAEGIAQLMPATRKQLYAELKFPASATAFQPEYAIPAAAYYMAKLRRAWFMKRTEDERRRLAFASYNAGLGSILHAQRAAGNALDYATIIEALPKITGDANAAQTTTYVSRIERWYAQLLAEATPQSQVP